MLSNLLQKIRENPGITLESLMDLQLADADYLAAGLARLTERGQLSVLEVPANGHASACKGQKTICFFCRMAYQMGHEYALAVQHDQ